MELNTTPRDISVRPEDLLCIIMSPDDLRDLTVTSLTSHPDGDKVRGLGMTFNEMVGVMALSHSTAQSNGVVPRFSQIKHKNKRKVKRLAEKKTN